MGTQGRRGWGWGVCVGWGMGCGSGEGSIRLLQREGGFWKSAGLAVIQRQAVGKSLSSSNCTLVPSSVEMCHVTSSS